MCQQLSFSDDVKSSRIDNYYVPNSHKQTTNCMTYIILYFYCFLKPCLCKTKVTNLPSKEQDNISLLYWAQANHKLVLISKSYMCCLLLFLPVVPSAPSSFRIQQRHLDSIYVDWDLPAEPNGVITGYSLKYQTGTPTRHLKCSEIPHNVALYIPPLRNCLFH